MEWCDGSRYTGHWENGVQHGIGIMTFQDGSKRAGFFEYNLFTIPLKGFDQLRHIDSQMPDELFMELQSYIQTRDKKIKEMKA